jgi:putative aminopeptidase FrvX
MASRNIISTQFNVICLLLYTLFEATVLEDLKTLCAIPGLPGSEFLVKEWILSFVAQNQDKWLVKPEVLQGGELGDALILVFGTPRTAVFAHMDTVGYHVRYQNGLVPAGAPYAPANTTLVGLDEEGTIEGSLFFDEEEKPHIRFSREIARGTDLHYKPEYKEDEHYIYSPYLDNRLGVWIALQQAKSLENGVLAFSCWEEHGGGNVAVMAKILAEEFNVLQALISDVTWVTDGVHPGFGPAISLRDSRIPRKKFLNHIQNLASSSGIPFQLEVEGTGGSDGKELQTSPYGWDWAFIGVPQYHSHTPQEYVAIADVKAAVNLYSFLLQNL